MTYLSLPAQSDLGSTQSPCNREKPIAYFRLRQPVARAHALLRRAGRVSTPAVRRMGPLALHPGRQELHVGQGEAIPLTP